MLRDIIRPLRNKLKDSFFENDGSGIITHIAGLTRVKEVLVGTGLIRKVPVPVDSDSFDTEEVCITGEPIFYLVPDERKRCIVYFEGTESKAIDTKKGLTNYTANANLICWYNSKGFQNEPDINSRLCGLFISKLKDINPVTDKIKSIEVGSVSDSNGNIFSKYSYNDFRGQYLGSPFGSFSINFKINFSNYETQDCYSPVVPIDIALDC